MELQAEDYKVRLEVPGRLYKAGWGLHNKIYEARLFDMSHHAFSSNHFSKALISTLYQALYSVCGLQILRRYSH